MTKRRAFKPPPTCSHCGDRPNLGETLFNTGAVWICATCLTEESGGGDMMTKMATHSLRAERAHAASRRAKASGDIGEAASLQIEAQWHHQAAVMLKQQGSRMALRADVVGGEAVPTEAGYLRDTLRDPDLAAIESSETRGRLLQMNDALALGVDVSNTIGAANTAEKLLAHEIAVAHKVALEQVRKAQSERDPAMEVKRLQVSAKMMATVQEGFLAIQRLKSNGPQSVTVQHVHVNAGGQAVVGRIDTS